jgi:hypothetical protein
MMRKDKDNTMNDGLVNKAKIDNIEGRGFDDIANVGLKTLRPRLTILRGWVRR